MKKNVIISIFLGVFISISVVLTLNSTEKAISQGVIRLHVRANSNLAEDIELKLKVRDAILKKTGDVFKNTTTVAEAKTLTQENIDFIKEVASKEVADNGYNYPVRVTFEETHFPTKTYENLCLPLGSYEALVVEIGLGEGDNWWCVMFPPLCFVDGTCESIPNQSEEILIENMGEDAYGMVSGTKPKIKFKVYELWQKLNK